MAILSTMVAALLSRAVNDERLSERFPQAAAESALMGRLRNNAPTDGGNGGRPAASLSST